MSKPKRGSLVKKNCECCKNEFTARLADHLRGWARFCSRACKARHQAANAPARAEPIDLTNKSNSDEDHADPH